MNSDISGGERGGGFGIIGGVRLSIWVCNCVRARYDTANPLLASGYTCRTRVRVRLTDSHNRADDADDAHYAGQATASVRLWDEFA